MWVSGKPGASGGEINFGGAREVYFVWIGEGHEKFIPVWIKSTRWGAKIQRDFSAEIGISSGFSGRKQVISEKKKRSSSQKCHEIRCQSTKNSILGLDLHSSGPEPVNFFGAQSSLGGAQLSFGGARPRYAPPWRRSGKWCKARREESLPSWFLIALLHTYLLQSIGLEAQCKENWFFGLRFDFSSAARPGE